MDSINVFTPKFRKREILDEISDCLDKGWTGLGYKTVDFEKKWTEYCGLPNSLFISSNTAGLQLALRTFSISDGWEKGDEVITTPLTFVSTNHVILHEDLKPIFCDVDESLCIDPEIVESLITPKTKALMFVGMGGNPGRLDVIQKICSRNNLRLILDAAHMAGTYVRSKGGKVSHVGFEADATVFSFQAVKNLPTADSGAICFKDKECGILGRKLSWLGIDKDTYARSGTKGQYLWKYDVPHVGFKFNGNSIMAAIALVQLKYLDQDNDYRNVLCERYEKLLKPIKNITIIKDSDYCYKSSKHLFQILVESKEKSTSYYRDKLMQSMYDQNIYPGVHYVDNTEYNMYKKARYKCPKSLDFSNRLISLPLHLGLTDVDLKRVTDVFLEFGDI